GPQPPGPGSCRVPGQAMEPDPVAVALKFGFVAVLYLYLLWVARSALRELRGTAAPAPQETGYHSISGREPAGSDAWLIVEAGGGRRKGGRVDPFAGGSTGRPPRAHRGAWG